MRIGDFELGMIAAGFGAVIVSWVLSLGGLSGSLPAYGFAMIFVGIVRGFLSKKDEEVSE